MLSNNEPDLTIFRKIVTGTLAVTGKTAILLGVLLYLGQNKMLLHPDRAGQYESPVIMAPGWATEWKDGNAYLGMVYAPATEPKGTIVVFHGNAGTARDRENIARVLTDHGFRAVLVEYPAFDGRPGKATLANVRETALQDFKEVQKKWPGPYYLLGEFLGAGVVAQVAAQNGSEVKGVALFTPWDSLYNAANGKFFGLPIGLLLHEKFDSVAGLSGFKGPVAVIGAEKDALIPIRHAKALAAAHAGALFIELPDSTHNSWPSYMGAKEWEQVLSHLTKTQDVAGPDLKQETISTATQQLSSTEKLLLLQ